MSFHRAFGALAIAVLVLAGCQKTADKGKTEDQLVASGFTKDQAKCVTDDIWDKVPSKERNQLTDPKATPTADQKKIFFTAAVKCARPYVEDQIKAGVTASATTPTQVDCIMSKLTDDDLVAVMSEASSDALTAAATACASS